MINAETLNFGGVETYYSDGAKAIIKQALAGKPQSNSELVNLVESYQSNAHSSADLQYLKNIAINALARSGIR